MEQNALMSWPPGGCVLLQAGHLQSKSKVKELMRAESGFFAASM